jgi:hypothetical protein
MLDLLKFIKKTISKWGGEMKFHMTMIEYFKYCSFFPPFFSLHVNVCRNMNTIQQVFQLNLL